MSSAFAPRLRILSHLKRWSIMPTVFPDYVASHSFFVAIYSLQIADLIHWDGHKGALLTYALLHDVPEAITGDVCVGAKEAFVDKGREARFILRKTDEILPSIGKLFYGLEPNLEVDAILKAADKLDAALYCAMETAFGNSAMAARLPYTVKDLSNAWDALPATESRRTITWKLVERAVMEHQSGANYDVEKQI